MKLREEPGLAHLIAYERPDLPGERESRYRLVEVPEPTELRAALAATLGIRIVVDKSRRLFVFAGVRIHLDRVAGLGDFIELEGVVVDAADPQRFDGLLADLRRTLAIRDGDLVGESYSDLLAATAVPTAGP